MATVTTGGVDRRRQVAQGVALLRVGYGALMLLAPRRMVRFQAGREPAGETMFLARLFGIRDAVLGAGALLAADDDARRGWVAAGVASDALDCVSALGGGRRQLGRARALFVAATAASATAGGAWSLTD